MSTRGVYTFTDGDQTVHVYKHCDNYPEGDYGGLNAIQSAMLLAWELPRFEPDEFAAAFVAANKGRAGNLRLFPVGISEPHEFAADAEYHYTVTRTQGGSLQVKVDAVDWWDGEPKSETLFFGRLADAHAWAAKWAADR